MVDRVQGRVVPLVLGRGLVLPLAVPRVQVKAQVGMVVVMGMGGRQVGVWLGEGGPRLVCCLGGAQWGVCCLQGPRLQGQVRCLGVGVEWHLLEQRHLVG